MLTESAAGQGERERASSRATSGNEDRCVAASALASHSRGSCAFDLRVITFSISLW